MASFLVDSLVVLPTHPQHKFNEDFLICQTRVWGVNHRGIWYGDNPLKYGFPLLVFQIILAFFISRSIYILLRPFKQSKFVCNVLGGIILGPSVISRNKEVQDKLFPPGELLVLNTLSSLSTIYFVFIISVKMNTAMIFKTARKAWTIGLSCLGFPMVICGCLIVTLRDYLPSNSRPFLAYLDASLSMTYFPVIAHALDELNLLTSELGQLAMSAAMLNEMVAWTLKFFSLTERQKSFKEALGAVSSIGALVIFSVYGIRPAVLQINKRTPEGKQVPQIYVIIILVGVLVMAFVTDMLGAFAVNGALLLGLIIPDGPPLGATLVEKSELLVMEFLLPIFYITIGIHTDIYSIRDWKSFAPLQLIIVFAYISKLVGTVVYSLLNNMRLRNAIILGLMLNMKGVIELMTYRRLVLLKYANQQVFSMMVLSALTVTAIVTPLVEFLYNPHMRLNVTSKRRIKSLQTTQSNVELRVLSCIHKAENAHSIITLFEACNPTQQSPICAYVIHLVELVGRAAPFLVPHSNNNGICMSSSTNSSDHIMRAFENYSRNSFGSVIVQPFTMVAPYKSMHENICRLAEDNLIPLIILLFHESHEVLGRSIRSLSTNMQSYAPCTVGILVDRGSSCRHMINHTQFSYHVAVLFLGGADDREVLAFGVRMSGNPGVSITVVRIILCYEDNDEVEKQLDESLINEFKLKNISNACAVCSEVEAKDSVQALKTIRSLENSYDLVMVGRRHENMAVFDEEMAEWTENAELGVIGDILASKDFCGGMVSVLVMQQCRGDTRANSNESGRFIEKFNLQENSNVLRKLASFAYKPIKNLLNTKF